jgi:hypothetical protein
MPSVRRKGPTADTSEFKLIKWEITKREVSRRDPENPGQEIKEEQVLITSTVNDGLRGRGGDVTNNRQVYETFLTRHSFEAETVLVADIEAALMADHIADQYE